MEINRDFWMHFFKKDLQKYLIKVLSNEQSHSALRWIRRAEAKNKIIKKETVENNVFYVGTNY